MSDFMEKVKAKTEEIKSKAIDKGRKTADWVISHPVESLALMGAVTSAVSKGYKCAKLYEDKVHRERDFYDPRCGKTTRAKRKLKPWEYDEVEFRYESGESYNSILRDMGLRK